MTSSSRIYQTPDSVRNEESVFTGMEKKDHNKRIITLLILAPLWTLVFTVIPVVVKVNGIGADIYRFVEPIVSLPLNYFILASSEIFDHNSDSKPFVWGLSERGFLNVWFMVAAAFYAQGAGMHSTAILAKHWLNDLIAAKPDIVTSYPEVNDMLYYFQTTLEHVIGHYMYAFGSALISWSHLFAYRRQVHKEIESRSRLAFWILSGITYSLILGGVAIEFPKGKRLVLQSYLIGYFIAFFIIVIWVIAIGGFKDRKSAGVLAN
ncbi:15957_t:CDS:2 [Dentiscutata erythropus]|uniref:15957_t:CDS:1 n=1 Tax=Dentiscutata erythropus TaxID=1348616 RepID=A0A9N8Z7B7_9GLOM|nr:15957_t:CDS:2 [Dentiscutata erythropus]